MVVVVWKGRLVVVVVVLVVMLVEVLGRTTRRGVKGVAPISGSGILWPGMDAGTWDCSVTQGVSASRGWC